LAALGGGRRGNGSYFSLWGKKKIDSQPCVPGEQCGEVPRNRGTGDISSVEVAPERKKGSNKTRKREVCVKAGIVAPWVRKTDRERRIEAHGGQGVTRSTSEKKEGGKILVGGVYLIKLYGVSFKGRESYGEKKTLCPRCP